MIEGNDSFGRKKLSEAVIIEDRMQQKQTNEK
jgi:hypothetical protein